MAMQPDVRSPVTASEPPTGEPASLLAAGAPGRPLRVGAIVLAAGASTRMGTPKQLLDYRGQPLLLHTVQALLESPAWPVIVVLGAFAEQIRPVLARLPVLTVETPAWPEGMAASIRTGITTLQQFSRTMEAALIALCDQPAFSPPVVTQLIAAQRNSRCSIVAARYGGRHGVPALFLKQHFAALAALTGEQGARNLLTGEISPVAHVDLPELAFDLDTPADYAALQPRPGPL